MLEFQYGNCFRQKTKKLIAIYGPTISGKTGLAVNLAKYVWGRYNIEVEFISADSRKIYKDLHIGQANLFPPFDQKLSVRMTKFLPLDKKLSLHDYKKMTEEIVDELHSQGRLPILFGGTGVYVLSIIENWVVPQRSEATIEEEKTGGRNPPKYETLLLVPDFNKRVLFRAIKASIERNFERGIYDEVRGLVKKHAFNPLNPERWNILYETIGYREFLEYAYEKQNPLDKFNNIDLMKVKSRIFTDTKDLARRQINFLPKFKSKNTVRSWQDARALVDDFLGEG